MKINEKYEYSTEDLIAGSIRNDTKAVLAGTYFKGQVLGRVDADQTYVPWNSSATDGSETIRAVVIADRELSADGFLPVYISGTEVMDCGLKDENGDKITLTSADIESAQDNGIYVKEV